MNRFDDDLRRAARGKRATAVITTFAILVFGLVLAGYFLSFRSLSITVQPQNAKQTAIIPDQHICGEISDTKSCHSRFRFWQ
jgi:hypothetical protein